MEVKSKRIVKNTFFLAIRLVILTFIMLYTSRVVLDTLGVIDYGIYNVIGSLAVTFVFFSSSLTNATQRFLNIELGKGSLLETNRVLNQHNIVYCIICIFTIIVAEILGIWYINNKINIPTERIPAALWVFQFSIVSLIICILTITYESLVIAHEDMKVYSVLGVVDGIFKLFIAFLIAASPFDRLIFYALLMAIVTISCRLFFVVYCYRNYAECYLKWRWDTKAIKKMFSFISWNVISTAQVAISDQGVTLLLNTFCGPIINAARGVTAQVSGAIFKFSSTIQVSTQPQIVKSYAAGDNDYLITLFFNSSRFSFFLLWLFVCPVLFCIDLLLSIWLREVPNFTSQFVQWQLAGSLVYILSKPVWSVIIATGKLKKYVLYSSGISILIFPISYILLKIGYSPISVYISNFFILSINTIAQLIVLNGYVRYSYMDYISQVIIPIFRTVIPSVWSAYIICYYINNDLFNMILAIVLIIFITAGLIWLFGLTHNEKHMIILKVKSLFINSND